MSQPLVSLLFGTIREKKSAAYDYKPSRKGSRKYKQVVREPRTVAFVITKKFETLKEFHAALIDEVGEDCDLRTVRYHQDLMLGESFRDTGVSFLDLERDV